MPRATNLVPFEFTFGERTAVMRADIVDRVELTIDIEQRDGPAIEVEQLLSARRNFVQLGHSDGIRHCGATHRGRNQIILRGIKRF
jgi:hypothetical protein